MLTSLIFWQSRNQNIYLGFLGILFTFSLLAPIIARQPETPAWLKAQGRIEEYADSLQKITQTERKIVADDDQEEPKEVMQTDFNTEQTPESARKLGGPDEMPAEIPENS